MCYIEMQNNLVVEERWLLMINFTWWHKRHHCIFLLNTSYFLHLHVTGQSLHCLPWARPRTTQQKDAQLSQRDRAAGCIIVLAKSGRLELGDEILRTLYIYLQPLWYNRPENLSNSVKKHKIEAITVFNVIQGHRGRYQSTVRMQLPISD